jgi:hypothetical protein
VAPFIWGVLLDDGNYHEFETTKAFTDWCHAQEDPLILYAHNGGKFDYHFLREDIESDSPISVIAGRLARCKIGQVELRDSLNLFGQTRLADFSKEEIDYRLMRKDIRHLHMPEIRKYLKSDCVNLLTLVTKFLERYGMQFTQAGASMKYWAKHYAPKQSDGRGYIPKQSAAQFETYSPFFFGGRVQCFVSGYERKDFSVVDINSAYPRAMLDSHPYEPTGLVTSCLPREESAIPQCLIELDAVSKGALALRSEDRSLFFPEDETKVRRYFTTGWEYLAGLETNTLRVEKIIRVHQFGTPVNFKGYIEHFFNERANAKLAEDKAGDIFAKIFMNSLYGKWAANPTRYEEFVLSEHGTDAYQGWLSKNYEDRGRWGGRQMLSRKVPTEKHRYYNIATAASITGWVRAFLWRSLLKCSNPLYCDTDSIAAVDTSALDLGKKLGQWKLEAQCDEYAIAGKKNYAFHVKGKPRPVHVKRQKPLDAPESRAQWDELRKCWKLASKGSDLSPREMIAAACGFEVLNRASVPNFSIHKNEFSFIDRKVRNTWRNIADMDNYEDAA